MKNEPKIHHVYKHFKGDLYIVEDICEHSETSEKMVLYRALYGEGKLYVRPLKMFWAKLITISTRKWNKNTGSNCKKLKERIDSRLGREILPYTESLGFGETKYELIEI